MKTRIYAAPAVKGLRANYRVEYNDNRDKVHFICSLHISLRFNPWSAEIFVYKPRKQSLKIEWEG